MFKLDTKIDVNSKEFKQNKKAFLKLLNDYKGILKDVTRGGSENAIRKHK